jgi:hypothetical protein
MSISRGALQRPVAEDRMADERTNLVEVRVLELKLTFNAIDPSPFRYKDWITAA